MQCCDVQILRSPLLSFRPKENLFRKVTAILFS